MARVFTVQRRFLDNWNDSRVDESRWKGTGRTAETSGLHNIASIVIIIINVLFAKPSTDKIALTSKRRRRYEYVVTLKTLSEYNVPDVHMSIEDRRHCKTE